MTVGESVFYVRYNLFLLKFTTIFHHKYCIRKRIKDDNFGFADMGCLVMVRRVHIWSSGCRPCRYPLRYKYGPPDHYQTTYVSKTKIVVFYSLSNAFDLISGSKFGEDIKIISKLFRNNPRLSVGESILFIHACA